MRSRSSWRSWPGLSWARARWLCWACVLLALFLPRPLPALTPSETALIGSLLEESRQLQLTLQELGRQSSEQSLLSAELEQKLTQAEQKAQQLDARLQLWQEHSAELSDSLETLSSELAASRSSLAALRSDLDALSKASSAYKRSAESRILALESSARTWRVVALAGIPAAVLLGALAVLLIP
ncbi:MAG: hypothetical protein WC683_07850 [bacterium]